MHLRLHPERRGKIGRFAQQNRQALLKFPRILQILNRRFRKAYGFAVTLEEVSPRTNSAPRSLWPMIVQWAGREGLMIFKPTKSLSLSVTTTQSFASVMAATIMSSGLRGRPAAVPPAISRAQTRAAFSSNGRTRPANSACGPSGPENQRSNSLRFFPAGFSSNPRRISGTVGEVIMARYARGSTAQLGSDWEELCVIRIISKRTSRSTRLAVW